MLLSVRIKGIFVINYKISGRIVSICGIRPDIKNGRISGQTLLFTLIFSNSVFYIVNISFSYIIYIYTYVDFNGKWFYCILFVSHFLKIRFGFLIVFWFLYLFLKSRYEIVILLSALRLQKLDLLLQKPKKRS